MKRKDYLPLVLLFLVILLGGCSKEQGVPEPGTIRFMVASDIHYFDPSLFSLPANSYLNNYLENDRKLILESSAILNSLISVVMKEKPDFLLIPGDLTKDGEKQDHQMVSTLFKSLTNNGIKVLVIPGNHDINNPNSYSYLQTGRIKVDNLSPSDFASVYSDFGYGEVLDRDPNSLSYVTEPVEGLWVLGIDACRYSPVTETAGSIGTATQAWIKTVIADAQKSNKLLIAMMHHGLAEHFAGQTTFYPGFVIDDWQTVAGTLADLGLKLVFTGHSHAQDIVKVNSSKGFIFDIETGSTVTYPCPYRKVTINLESNQVKIESATIHEVTFSTIPSGTSFQSYAKSFLTSDLNNLVYSRLSVSPYNIPVETIQILGLDRILTNAFIAHTTGNESPSATDNADIQIVKALNPSMGSALQNVWSDQAPADNNLVIDLSSGEEIKN